MFRFLKYTFLLLAAVAIVFIAWCYIPPARQSIEAADYPWKKGMTAAEVDQTARELLSQMTLEEKIDQLHGDQAYPLFLKGIVRWFVLGQGRNIAYAGRNDRLHIPPLGAADGPRGVSLLGKTTCFPVTMARGASWDPALERRVGAAMGIESRVRGVNYNLGGCINLLRNPAWGRAQETYGEDPWLLGEMGAAWVRGVQQHNVMACVKHFALNSLENNRFKVNVTTDERTLREVYLPHFKKCVDAGAASFMSAYNQVNGEYCGHNRYLLTDILRQEWGFQGFVSSDWIYGIYAASPAANAGMDVEMPLPRHYSDLAQAVREGRVAEKTIDEMVLRVLRTKLWFITRPDPQAYTPDMVASPQHRALALESAEKSMVLLKNEAGFLPFQPAKLKKIAVIGPLATAENTGDHGSSAVKPPTLVTLLEGIQTAVGAGVEVIYEPGINAQKAAAAAGQADAVVLVAGYRYNDEGENLSPFRDANDPVKWGSGGDRIFLRLREDDEVRIQTISAVNPRTVVVVVGGSAIVMDSWQSQVPAILMAWYPGMEGGTALANILFGKVNPSGKLPFTIAHSEADYPWFSPMTDTITYGPYHGYTLLDKKGKTAAFPFGFGLSYTTFSYSKLTGAKPVLSPTDTLQVLVNVTNTGQSAGEEVVQLYIGFENSPVERPKKLLRGFEKIGLQAGETKVVRFQLPVRELAYYDPTQKKWVVAPGRYAALVGNSSRDEDLQRTPFEVR